MDNLYYVIVISDGRTRRYSVHDTLHGAETAMEKLKSDKAKGLAELDFEHCYVDYTQVINSRNVYSVLWGPGTNW